MKVILPIVLLFIICSCSKKTPDAAPLPFSIPDSSFVIQHARQLDLNEFGLKYCLNAKDWEKFQNAGIVTVNDNNPADTRYKEVLPTYTQISQWQTIGDLKGDQTYSVRLYVVNDNDTVYSQPVQIHTTSLKINTRGYQQVFSRPMEVATIETNLPDTNKTIHSEIWLDDFQCTMYGESGAFVYFSIPDQVPAGYHTLKIKRKGLEASVDSVKITFGKFKALPDYPVDRGPAQTDENYFTLFGAFNVNNKGYIFGGSSLQALYDASGNFYSRVNYFLEYEPIDGSWTKVDYAQPTYFSNPQVEIANNKAYIVGGTTDSTRTGGSTIPLTNVYEFDRDNRVWIKKAALPFEPTRFSVTTFSSGNKIYVGKFGPNEDFSYGFTSEFWVYDPAADSWTRKADFPAQSRFQTTTFFHDNNGYVVGGQLITSNQSTWPTNDIWQYDVLSDSWKQIQVNQNIPPRFGSQAIVYSNKAYLIGGWQRDDNSTSLNTAFNYEFDIHNNTFEEITRPISSTGGGVLAVNGNRFVLAANPADYNTQWLRHVTEFKAE